MKHEIVSHTSPVVIALLHIVLSYTTRKTDCAYVKMAMAGCGAMDLERVGNITYGESFHLNALFSLACSLENTYTLFVI